MNKQNQNGSIHVIIICLLTLALIGALGWIFWQNFLQPKTEVKTAATSQKTSPSPSPSASVQVKPAIVALTSWGVQFPVTDDLKSAGVEAVKESSGNYTDYVVTTAKQRAFGQLTEANASKLCDAGSGVTVLQVASSKPGDGDTSQQLTTKPIAGFYYTWSIPSAGGCSGPDTKAIVAALKNLEAIN